jgi:hypothetical protein
VRAHRGGDAAASLTVFEPREHERDPLERKREADDTTAVDCRLQLAGLELGGGCDLGQDLVLERMAGEPVPLGLPAASPARGEHAGVLAGAVVEDRLRRTALLDSHLEVFLGRRRLREQASDSLDLLRFGAVRSRCDRDVLVVEVVPGANEGQRLKRLRRRAQRRQKGRVTRLGDDRAVPNRDRVHDVHGFNERPAVHGYAERIHEGGSVSA